jgi:hypothetical protein
MSGGDRGGTIDMTGVRVGALTVIRQIASAPFRGNARWLCRCDCGRTDVREGIQLRKLLKEDREGRRPYPFSCPACRPKRCGTYQRKR